MKPLPKFLTLLGMLLLLPSIQAEELGRNELALLIEGVMPPHSREQAVRVIYNPGEFTPDEVKHARERIKKAKVAVNKLHATIKVGKSIFDYPGLLARGFLRYQNMDNYRYYILSVSAADEGRVGVTDPNGFVVHFDDLGRIIAIKNPPEEAH